MSKTRWDRVLAGDYGFAICPLDASEIAHFYWCTDLKTPEIHEAFPEWNFGEAEIVAAQCSDCGVRLHVKSRNEAEEWLPRLQQARNDIYLKCKQCQKRYLEERDAPFHAEMRKLAMRAYELRRMPYAEYLKTPEWQSTRRDALKRAGFKCQMCSNGGKLHVHHRTYFRRGAERNSDLIVLCADCHQLFHDNGKLAENGRAA